MAGDGTMLVMVVWCMSVCTCVSWALVLRGTAGVTSIISGVGERRWVDTEPIGTSSIPSLTLADLISFTISSFRVWISRSFILSFSWAVAEAVAAAVVVVMELAAAVDGLETDDAGSKSLFCISVLLLGLAEVVDGAGSLGKATFCAVIESRESGLTGSCALALMVSAAGDLGFTGEATLLGDVISMGLTSGDSSSTGMISNPLGFTGDTSTALGLISVSSGSFTWTGLTSNDLGRTGNASLGCAVRGVSSSRISITGVACGGLVGVA